MIESIAARIKSIYSRWLDRRIPSSRSVTLTQKRIFIFPGKVGFTFLMLVILLFVTSINYQNNLLFSFSCLMVSLFVTAIVATYRNLSGLQIQSGHTESVFAGDVCNVELTLSAPDEQERYAFEVGIDTTHTYNLAAVRQKTLLSVPVVTKKRGKLKVPRIKLLSVYPLGLLRCWTWLNLDFDVWVYPKPVMRPIVWSKYGGKDADDELESMQAQSIGDANDDFYGFRSYQAGDSLKHVAWRQYAKTQQLHTKEFSEEKGGSYWLDWNVLEGHDSETRLSVLCGWILQCQQSNQEYGLILPSGVIEKSSGPSHQKHCLMALAKYGMEE